MTLDGLVNNSSFSDSVHSRGVTILFKKNIDIEVINHHYSQVGRKLLVNFKYKENIFSLVNVYLPNHEKLRVDFLKRLLTWVNQNATSHNNLIVCGDFQLDKSNDKSSNILKTFIHMFNLTDSWSLSEIKNHKIKD
jgi:exonuclease III